VGDDKFKLFKFIMPNFITYVQIQKIHIAVEVLGLSRREYEDKLQELFGVRSSKGLTYRQADEMLKVFKQAGWIETITKKSNKKNKKQYGFGKNKYENLSGRGKPYAKPRKLRLIEVLWREVSNEKTDEALQKFIYKRTGISHITMLCNSDANICITALKAMQLKKESENVAVP